MLTIKKSVHGLLSVEVRDVPVEVLRVLSSGVARNRFDDPVYQLRKTAQAFLQGYDEQYGGWALVEFWTDDEAKCQPFVDWLNKEIAKQANS